MIKLPAPLYCLACHKMNHTAKYCLQEDSLKGTNFFSAHPCLFNLLHYGACWFVRDHLKNRALLSACACSLIFRLLGSSSVVTLRFSSCPFMLLHRTSPFCYVEIVASSLFNYLPLSFHLSFLSMGLQRCSILLSCNSFLYCYLIPFLMFCKIVANLSVPSLHFC